MLDEKVKVVYQSPDMETKEDLIKDVRQKLFRIVIKHSQLEAVPKQLSDGTELTHRELHAVSAIGESAHLSVTGLGTHFGITKSAASQMVSKLVQKGLVEKSNAAHSNREFQLALTELGKQAYRLHERIHREHMAVLGSRLDAFSLSQIATFSVMLGVIEGVVDERMEKESP